jgi:predicted metal-dependent hydrolase
MCASVPTINLQGRRIEYSVVSGRARKYTYLRFRDDAVLEVVAHNPRSLDAEIMIRERQAWVLKHFEELSSSQRVLTDDSVMFDGRRLRIVLESSDGKEELRPDLAEGEVIASTSEEPRVKELIRRWFLKESSSYVVRELPALALKLNVSYSRADVREIRSWGYCTRDGKLSFGWQLIALPERLREYVLCHELAHLAEHNHSRGFKEKLRSILPDYRVREKQLGLIIPS